MFPCNKCNRKFTYKDTLEQHIKLKHNTKMYLCDQCDYESTDEKTMTTHTDVLHKNGYSCEYCDFESEEKEKLTIHKKENHELPCEYCETEFVTESSLNLHINFKHNHENKICCEWCKNSEGKKVCIDCKKKSCDPCITGANQNSKEIMDKVLKKGIIDKMLETNEFV